MSKLFAFVIALCLLPSLVSAQNPSYPLVYCGTTTSAPTNTTGQNSPLSCGTDGSLRTNPSPSTVGGLTTGRVLTGTTGVIKASAGQLYTLTVYNVNAAVRYLHLYNKATAPTLSTDTPILTIPIAAGQARDLNYADLGVAFSTGISWSYTTDDIAIPATAATSTELHFTAGYK